jgi:hypothetical protein
MEQLLVRSSGIVCKEEAADTTTVFSAPPLAVWRFRLEQTMRRSSQKENQKSRMSNFPVG